VVVDQAEILSLATAPRCRRQGVGRALLDAVLAAMTRHGASAVWLEVRISNDAARRMYEAAGFVAAGLRRGYYRQPPEDAAVLRRDLPAARVGKS
jgi:ribosomal-protein-alanine N-acetyltransferase